MAERGYEDGLRLRGKGSAPLISMEEHKYQGLVRHCSPYQRQSIASDNACHSLPYTEHVGTATLKK